MVHFPDKQLVATYDVKRWCAGMRNAIAGSLLSTAEAPNAWVCVKLDVTTSGQRIRSRLIGLARTKLSMSPWHYLQTVHTKSEPLRIYARLGKLRDERSFRANYRNYEPNKVEEMLAQPAIVTPALKYTEAIAAALCAQWRDSLPQHPLTCTFCAAIAINGVDGWDCGHCGIAACTNCLAPCLHVREWVAGSRHTSSSDSHVKGT